MLANVNYENINFIARSNSYVNAGEIIKIVANETDGNGGGSNKFAQGAGKNIDKLDNVLKKIKTRIQNG